MNCSEALEFLSPLHDGELPADVRASVQAHYRECPSCAAAKTNAEALTALVMQQTDPTPPANLWTNIDATLTKESLTTANVEIPSGSSRKSRLAIGITAVVLIAISVTMVVQHFADTEHAEHLAVNFDEFLNAFPESPERAQRLLHANYASELVSVEKATREVRYRPAVSNQLPVGYSLDSVHLVRMPCCLCVESLCTAPDGARLAILEHAIDQPVWFGERPIETVETDGGSARLVRFNGRLAATWKTENRFLTIIGVRDEEELGKLMQHLDPSSA